MRLNRMNVLAACCHFSVFIGSFLYQRVKPPQGIVLFINLLGKGLTPRACVGDGDTIFLALFRTVQGQRNRVELLRNDLLDQFCNYK